MVGRMLRDLLKLEAREEGRTPIFSATFNVGDGKTETIEIYGWAACELIRKMLEHPGVRARVMQSDIRAGWPRIAGF